MKKKAFKGVGDLLVKTKIPEGENEEEEKVCKIYS
jgi:hypothetical protein